MSNKKLIDHARSVLTGGVPVSPMLVHQLVDALEKAESGHPPAPFVFPHATRVTIVGTGTGVLFESYHAWPAGAELHQQDQGRTLKLFPKQY